MKSKFRKLWFVMAMLILVWLIFPGNIAFAELIMGVSVARQTDVLGPEKHADAYMIRYDVRPDNERMFNPIVTMGVLYDRRSGALCPKAGIGFMIRYCRFSVPISAVVMPGAGRIDGLAHATAYGEIGLLFEVTDNMGFFIAHISSPFHSASDGDHGINLVGMRIHF